MAAALPKSLIFSKAVVAGQLEAGRGIPMLRCLNQPLGQGESLPLTLNFEKK
jgi:hypothetical protein